MAAATPNMDSSRSTIKDRIGGNAWKSPPSGLTHGLRRLSTECKETVMRSSKQEEEGVDSLNDVRRGGATLSPEEREAIRFRTVGRKKDFKCVERVNGRQVNVLQGLELHTRVFSSMEQDKIVNCVYELQEMGRRGRLRERTYSEPIKWMRGKGRVTIQFGCCYNYARDRNGNPPGIIRDEEVDPIPPLLKNMIKRMVAWHILPPTCIPNSCIVNIYEKDDCIPPHIDHHDFVRPFCTVSFLSECKILFGSELKVLGPGDFSGSTAIPLPVGSVLILQGNGADVAKHCVPAVPAKRISITFRKMDDRKLPFRFTSDPELQNLRPLSFPVNRSPIQRIGNHVAGSPIQQQPQPRTPSSQDQYDRSWSSGDPSKSKNGSDSGSGSSRFQSIRRKSSELVVASAEKSVINLGQDDFPSLDSSSCSKPLKKPSRSLRQ